MRKTLSILSFLSIAGYVQAQSVAEGQQQLYYERYNSAAATFHAVLQNQPENAQAWYGLTEAYILDDNAGKALDTLRQAPLAIRNQPYYEVAYGTVLLNRGAKDSAAFYFSNALAQTKEKDADILAAVAAAHIQKKGGDVAYALDLLQKAKKRDKRNPQLNVLEGDAYRRLQNGSESYKAYQEAINTDKKYAAAYTRLGDIFQTQKNADMYLEYYNKAIAADANYAPALYKLYLHAFYHDPAQAMQYYNAYLAKADRTLQTEYDLTDLYYLNKEYSEAIGKAKALMATEGENLQPRIYKLLGYSYAGLKDSAQAIASMQRYFATEADSNFIAKDYEAMADLYLSFQNNDSARSYLAKAAGVETDFAVLAADYKKLAALAGASKDYAAQASWLGSYYTTSHKASNVDLFNWGLAHYRASEFPQADSVFALYVKEHPDQGFGYYWEARSNVAMDSAMTQGLAIPYYKKLIEVMQNDTANATYKKWMVEAYGYIAAYETNTEKDYAEAVDYFEKLLEVDPENADAKKYIAVLEKRLASEDGSK